MKFKTPDELRIYLKRNERACAGQLLEGRIGDLLTQAKEGDCWLTTEEVAFILGQRIDEVRLACRDNKYPAIKRDGTWLIHLQALEDSFAIIRTTGAGRRWGGSGNERKEGGEGIEG